MLPSTGGEKIAVTKSFQLIGRVRFQGIKDRILANGQ